MQDDEDTLLFGDDASDTFLCMDEEHGTTPYVGQDVPLPDQGTQPNERELDDTLLMDDDAEDSEANDLMKDTQMDNATTLDDSDLGSGFDTDSDYLGLFEDQCLSSGMLHEGATEDQLDILNSEGISTEDEDQNDDR